MPDEDAEAQKRFEAAIGKLTKELTDKGLLIEAGWQSLRVVAFPRNAPTAALDQHKACFFAGAMHLWSSLMSAQGIMEPGDAATDNDERRMNAVATELAHFSDGFMARYRSKMN